MRKHALLITILLFIASGCALRQTAHLPRIDELVGGPSMPYFVQTREGCWLMVVVPSGPERVKMLETTCPTSKEQP